MRGRSDVRRVGSGCTLGSRWMSRLITRLNQTAGRQSTPSMSTVNSGSVKKCLSPVDQFFHPIAIESLNGDPVEHRDWREQIAEFEELLTGLRVRIQVLQRVPHAPLVKKVLHHATGYSPLVTV